MVLGRRRLHGRTVIARLVNREYFSQHSNLEQPLRIFGRFILPQD